MLFTAQIHCGDRKRDAESQSPTALGRRRHKPHLYLFILLSAFCLEDYPPGTKSIEVSASQSSVTEECAAETTALGSEGQGQGRQRRGKETDWGPGSAGALGLLGPWVWLCGPLTVRDKRFLSWASARSSTKRAGWAQPTGPGLRF